MRILHLGKYYPPVPGGMEVFLRDLAQAQTQRGHEVQVLVHQSPVRAPSSTDADGAVTLHRAQVLAKPAFTPLSPMFASRLAQVLKTFRPHMVHAHLPNFSPFALLLPGMRDIPLVVHWHSDVLTTGSLPLAMLYPAYAVLERALLRRASRIVATSPFYLEASRPLRSFRGKCRVVPLGLAPERMQRPPLEAVRDYRRDRQGFLVASVGRFSHYKGFEILVRAMARMRDARAVIVGSGPEQDAVARLVRELGLQDRVELPGAVDDAELRLILASCDAYCQPSIERTEAFGVVLLEAMVFAKPLVTTDLPGSGMVWVNEDGATGLIFAKGDDEALADALHRLQSDPNLCSSYGLEGLRRLEERFTIPRVAQAMDAVYREVC